MTISTVYKNFQTPTNLQQHMLRVAALAKMILDSWIGDFPHTIDCIQACLLHDIAKPMMFDLQKQAAFGLTVAEIQELSQLQKRLQKDYGETEHEAVLAICREIGCADMTITLVDNLDWNNARRFLDSSDMASLLPIYCDMRISPRGLLPLADRVSELASRDAQFGGMKELIATGLQIEIVIQQHITIDLNQITNEELDKRNAHLRQIDFAAINNTQESSP